MPVKPKSRPRRIPADEGGVAAVRAPGRNGVERRAAEEAVRTLLRWAGEDPGREGLRDTPKRVVKAYDAMVLREGIARATAVEAMEQSYAAEVTDEFVVPAVIGGGAPIKAGDSVMVLMRRVQTRGGRAVNVTLGG